jgi:hypothetical protein
MQSENRSCELKCSWYHTSPQGQPTKWIGNYLIWNRQSKEKGIINLLIQVLVPGWAATEPGCLDMRAAASGGADGRRRRLFTPYGRVAGREGRRNSFEGLRGASNCYPVFAMVEDAITRRRLPLSSCSERRRRMTGSWRRRQSVGLFFPSFCDRFFPWSCVFEPWPVEACGCGAEV